MDQSAKNKIKKPRGLSPQGKKISLLLLLAATTMAASCATTLQCGTDGESSYIELKTTTKIISQITRHMAELCSFAYEELE